MKFNRRKLLEYADGVIEDIEKRAWRRPEAFKLYAEHDAQQWYEKYADEWRQVRRVIDKALRAGKPVLSADIAFKGKPYSPPTESSTFTWNGVRYDGIRDERMLNSYTSFRDALSMVTDEEITLSDLKSMGYGMDMVSSVVADYRELAKKKDQED